MAYINYGQDTVGGKQLAEAMSDLQDAADKVRNIAAWVQQIIAVPGGVANLETNTDFGVATGEGDAFNNTIIEINGDLVTFMTTNRERIERLARGS
jgi:hypothetical protein